MREEAEAERQEILSQARAEASTIIANVTKTQIDYDSVIETIIKEYKQNHSDNG